MKAVIVKSFARIHLANLINFGIVPLTFNNTDDYDEISLKDDLEIIINDLNNQNKNIILKNRTNNKEYSLTHTLSPLDAQILKAGGKLPWIKTKV